MVKAQPRSAATLRFSGQTGQILLAQLWREALRHPELAKRAQARLGQAPAQRDVPIALSIVSAREMSTLNREYRGKRGPTDVLSFPTAPVFRGLLSLPAVGLGELIVCREVCFAQAREEGHGAVEELRILLAHGLLHLLGFDHERSERQARQMKAWEKKLLPPGRRSLIRRATPG